MKKQGGAPNHVSFLLLALGAALTLVIFIKGVWLEYSYWLDELYSVTAANRSLEALFRTVFEDVHPPLYYLTLRAWMGLFGESEAATRSLSFGFALLAVASLALLRHRLPATTLAVVAVLMLANAYFQVYAQEARANAMLVFLVTLGFAAAATGRWHLMLAASLAMGLIHYFGTIFAGLLLVWLWLENRHCFRLKLAAVCVFVLIAAWPLAQILFSPSRDLMGGAFWIRGGAGATLVNAVEAMLPPVIGLVLMVERQGGFALPVAAAIVVIPLMPLVLTVSWHAGRKLWAGRGLPAERLALQAALLIAGTVASVMLVSLHTPITLARSFIVLVPLVAIVLAQIHHIGANSRWRHLADVTLAVFVLGGFVVSLEQLAVKQAPRQDWKTTAEAALEYRAGYPMPIYHLTNTLYFPAWSDLVYNHYFFGRGESTALAIEEVAETEGAFLIVFGHLHCDQAGENRLTRTLRERDVPFDSFIPPQSDRCSNGYLVVRPGAGQPPS